MSNHILDEKAREQLTECLSVSRTLNGSFDSEVFVHPVRVFMLPASYTLVTSLASVTVSGVVAALSNLLQTAREHTTN